MECQDGTAQLADYLAGTLPAEQREAFQTHVAGCVGCRGELDAARETWELLGRIPPMPHDVAALRRRLDAVLTGYGEGSAGHREGSAGHRRRYALAGLAAAAMLLIGIALGRQIALPAAPSTAATAAPAAETQLAALRAEMGEMRQMMSLSLLRQPSATARLQGVVSIRQIDDPGGDVITALLDTLRDDPNANVRLAAIDALTRFMDRDLVKRGTLDALPRQTSPLVQIALIDFVAQSAGVASAETLQALSNDSTMSRIVRTRAAERLRQLRARS